MSINDPVYAFFDEKRWRWRLLRGNETFYNEQNQMIEFDTIDEAVTWAHDNLGVSVHLKPGQIALL